MGFSKGGFLIGTHGAEEFLAEFARAYRALPAVPFDDLPTGSDTLRVRLRAWEGDTWVYALNVSPEPVSVTLAVDGAQTHARDLSTGLPHPLSDGALTLALEPFQLRSFRFDGEAHLSLP